MFRITLPLCPQQKGQLSLLVASQEEELSPWLGARSGDKAWTRAALQGITPGASRPPAPSCSTQPHGCNSAPSHTVTGLGSHGKKWRRGNLVPPVSARWVSKNKSPAGLSFAAFVFQQRGGGVSVHLILSTEPQSGDLVQFLLSLASEVQNPSCSHV